MLREFGSLIDTGRIPIRSTDQLYLDMKQFWISVIGVGEDEATACAQMLYTYLLADDRSNLLRLKEVIPFYEEMVEKLRRYTASSRGAEQPAP